MAADWIGRSAKRSGGVERATRKPQPIVTFREAQFWGKD
jgi:hypothetical protein